MRCARITNDVVVEIIELSDDVELEALFDKSLNVVECGSDVEEGWQWDGASFSPPALRLPSKAEMIALAANLRWAKEVGGLSIAGMRIATDDRSKQMVLGLRVKADANPQFTTRFKGDDGVWFNVDAASIIALSDGVFAHVDAVFAIEDDVVAKITAGQFTTFEQVTDAFA